MTLLPIILSVTRASVRKGASSLLAQPVDEAAARASIFKRDGNGCRFCGFVSNRYQQIHFLNGDRRDWQHDNLATSCIYCSQCFTLERVSHMRSGTLVWMPEMSQAALHHLCRAIYVARISPGLMADAARSALDSLLLRREEAKRRIGTDDPATLTSVLQDYLEDSDYAGRKRKLEGIRLLPLDRRIVREADIEFNQFPQILAYWRSKDGPFGGALPQTWEESFRDLAPAEV